MGLKVLDVRSQSAPGGLRAEPIDGNVTFCICPVPTAGVAGLDGDDDVVLILPAIAEHVESPFLAANSSRYAIGGVAFFCPEGPVDEA